MADKEDSIHIKIKIDIDEEDKELIDNIVHNISSLDVESLSKKISPTLPRDERSLIKKIMRMGRETRTAAQVKKDDDTQKYIEELRNSPINFIKNFTKAQAANLVKFVSSPGAFFIAGLTKTFAKYGRSAMKGGIFAIIALLIYETVLFLLNELMKPGRLLDRRFKRIAQLETLSFYERTLQEELRHGYQEIRVTTQQGLRGGMSQVNGNLFEFSSSATGILQTSPYRNSQDIYQSQQSVGAITDHSGNPRRRSVFFAGR